MSAIGALRQRGPALMPGRKLKIGMAVVGVRKLKSPGNGDLGHCGLATLPTRSSQVDCGALRPAPFCA